MFLGTTIDLTRGELSVPLPKVQRYRGMVQQLRQQWSHDCWRSACGRLASFAEGLRMTPLFGRWLRSIGNGELADAEVEQGELQRMLELFDEQLPQLNGRAWRSVIAPALPVIADASDHEFGGYALYTGWECCISFTAAELQVLATLPAELSSTMREIRGARKTLQELLRTAPHLLAGGHVQIWGDNSAAISNCELMRGNPRVWPEAVLAEYACSLKNRISYACSDQTVCDTVMQC